MTRLIPLLLLVVGIVNMLPLTGVVSAARLEALYGVAVSGPDGAVLLRHRAVLLGIVGALLVAAAALPGLRAAAIVAGLVSMLSFVLLHAIEGSANPRLRTVAIIDIAASVALLLAALLIVRTQRSLP